jgi:hypothetical protein
MIWKLIDMDQKPREPAHLKLHLAMRVCSTQGPGGSDQTHHGFRPNGSDLGRFIFAFYL